MSRMKVYGTRNYECNIDIDLQLNVNASWHVYHGCDFQRNGEGCSLMSLFIRVHTNLGCLDAHSTLCFSTIAQIHLSCSVLDSSISGSSQTCHFKLKNVFELQFVLRWQCMYFPCLCLLLALILANVSRMLEEVIVVIVRWMQAPQLSQGFRCRWAA